MSYEAWGDSDDIQLHDPRCPFNCDLQLLYVVSTDWYECDYGHTGHLCDCGDLAQADAERAADAFADWEQAAFAAWEKKNG